MANPVKRADGRYQLNVYIGRDNGKSIKKTVYGKSPAEVKKKARELENQVDKGINVLDNNTAFSICVQKWLKMLESRTTESQHDLYEYRISVFSDVLGDKPIVKIKLDDLQNVINNIAIENPTTHKPSSQKTITNYISTLHLFYKYLIANRYLEFDVTESLTVPIQATSAEERRALTSQEQKWVKEFNHRAQLPAMIAMLCGLRRGEISALTWNEVDFNKKNIIVYSSYDFKKKRIKNPKTASGVRIVPMPDELIKFLKPLKGKSTDLVVKNTKGRRLTESGWDKLWTAYMNDLNMKYGDIGDWKRTRHSQRPPMSIEPFTMHCLRHTYATMLHDAGVDLQTAKKLMGHKKIETTLKIYTHLSAENEKANIDKLNSYLNKSAE